MPNPSTVPSAEWKPKNTIFTVAFGHSLGSHVTKTSSLEEAENGHATQPASQTLFSPIDMLKYAPNQKHYLETAKHNKNRVPLAHLGMHSRPQPKTNFFLQKEAHCDFGGYFRSPPTTHARGLRNLWGSIWRPLKKPPCGV